MTNDGFNYNSPEGLAHTFLQWKGTNACLDFKCSCGRMAHFDGYFAYVLECGYCGIKWEMPYILFPRQTDKAANAILPKEGEPGEP